MLRAVVRHRRRPRLTLLEIWHPMFVVKCRQTNLVETVILTVWSAACCLAVCVSLENTIPVSIKSASPSSLSACWRVADRSCRRKYNLPRYRTANQWDAKTELEQKLDARSPESTSCGNKDPALTSLGLHQPQNLPESSMPAVPAVARSATGLRWTMDAVIPT